MRSNSSTVSVREFTEEASLRDFSLNSAKRTFTASVSRRNFGVPVLGWYQWGQEDIYPFDSPTGVDSTKTFEDLR